MNNNEYCRALQQGQLSGYCAHPHHPNDVEKHARERLATLDKEIPEVVAKLANLRIEKSRLEVMLQALDDHYQLPSDG